MQSSPVHAHAAAHRHDADVGERVQQRPSIIPAGTSPAHSDAGDCALRRGSASQRTLVAVNRAAVSAVEAVGCSAPQDMREPGGGSAIRQPAMVVHSHRGRSARQGRPVPAVSRRGVADQRTIVHPQRHPSPFGSHASWDRPGDARANAVRRLRRPVCPLPRHGAHRAVGRPNPMIVSAAMREDASASSGPAWSPCTPA